MLYANAMLSGAMFLLGVVLLILILFRRWQRYFGRRAGPVKPRPRVLAASAASRSPLVDAPPELVRWQVEMHETARDLKAELDSKLGALQVLVRMAQQERERLEAAVAQARQLPGTDCCREAIYTLADQGMRGVAIAEQVGVPIGEVELILSLRRPQG